MQAVSQVIAWFRNSSGTLLSIEHVKNFILVLHVPFLSGSEMVQTGPVRKRSDVYFPQGTFLQQDLAWNLLDDFRGNAAPHYTLFLLFLQHADI